jgi:CrcB protein
MEPFAKVLVIGLGGAVGANIRYWLGGWAQSKWGADFPWSTFFINVSGSLVIGLFLGLLFALNWNRGWQLFIAVGLLGGYTTYSSFAYEAVQLLTTGQYLRALLYIEGTALSAVLAAWVGVVVSRLVLGGRV